MASPQAPGNHDFPVWPLRPQSALRRNGKAASGTALPPRPRSAATGRDFGNTGRPRLRLGTRDKTAMPLPFQKGIAECLVPQPSGQVASGSSGGRSYGAVPTTCYQRPRSSSNASGSTRDTERGGTVSSDLCVLHSSLSQAPSHDSVDVDLEFPFSDGPVAAATNGVASAPVAAFSPAAQTQTEQLEETISPAAAAADAECFARQRAPLPPRPASASSGPPARPSSAHIAAQSAQRLPLSSIAFVEQARPRTAHPLTRAPSQGHAEHGETRPTQHIQAVHAALVAKRSQSAGALRRRPPHQEALLAGKYRTLQYLGKGTSASVWEAMDDAHEEKVAIKVFEKHKSNWASRQKQALREARLLQSISHPAIIKVMGTFDAPQKFHIVMELVVGGSLRELLSQQPSPGLGEVTSRDMFEQICDGLNYCHQHNIVHRDLKLENILVESATGSAKIIDFGFALQLRLREQGLRVFCGTPAYMAPELVMGKEYSGFSTDMWALGVVLFGMLSGYLPFQGQTESQLYAKIRRAAFRFPDSVSEVPRRVVSGILRIDATSRPTAAQALQHRWLRPEACDANDAPKCSTPTPNESRHARPSSVPAYMRRLRTVHA